MPSDTQFKVGNLIHKSLLWLTHGHVGSKVAGLPVLELTTTGRKTGRPRTVMLVSPLRQDNSLVVVASRGGDDRHPDWFLNLVANPVVKVAVGGTTATTMRARVLDSREREAVWPEIVSAYRGYASYQNKTDREIPLVSLEPMES